jgi:adenosyl cobinamide kinase/adenosyl cobinamide phosphate guanylyltransferase
MGTIAFITGGVRSGKSAWALARAENSHHANKVFIATATLLDDEMRRRAENHRRERGPHWQTIEEPYAIEEVLNRVVNETVAVIDCLTVWLGNIWYKAEGDEVALSHSIELLCSGLERWRSEKSGELVIVSNEVGWGIVPPSREVRLFRDWAGKLNQNVTALAEEVYLSVAGIPLRIK